MSRKVKFWKRSPVYKNKRRPVNLGAFRKWQRENPGEAARIQNRFSQELQEA